MRCLAFLFTVLLAFSSPVLAGQAPASQEGLTPAQKEALQQEKDLHLLQRQIFDYPDAATALRHGITVLQSFGFYIEQVFPLDNVVQGISSENPDLLCALETRQVPGKPGKVMVWFNLHMDEDVITEPSPYKQLFKAFAECPVSPAAKGDPS